MDRKYGKYILNVEHSDNPLPNTCPHDQEAHRSACCCPPSNDVTTDVSSNLPGVWVSPRICAHSACSRAELPDVELNENCCSDWSLWKVFLACLLACAITTAIGVLILSLVNIKGNNSSIVIQLPTNSGQPTVIVPGTTSTTSQSTATTTSAAPTTTATASTITSTNSTGSTASTPPATTSATSPSLSETTAATTAAASVTTATATQSSAATRAATSTDPAGSSSASITGTTATSRK
ncbi:dynactin-associated protein [Oryctolagus cuniculus]